MKASLLWCYNTYTLNNNQTKFVHLHTHSHYSLLDGLSKIDDLVELAKKDGVPAIALTDHGNMYGAIEFYKKCKKAGIKPIIGVELYVTPGSRHSKQPGIDTKRFHLTLLAKNKTGYKNLITLVTKSFIEGFYYKPRVDKELLQKHSDGIVCLSGCYGGELSQALKAGKTEEARNIIKEHQGFYGKENYFLEIMHHPNVEGLEVVKNKIISLSKELDIPLVATQDSHYPEMKHQKAHETLLAIQTNTDLSSSDRFSMSSDDYSFINTKKALECFKNTPEAVSNTMKIADMCEVEIELGKWVFPDFTTTNGLNHDEELRRVVYEGISKRKLEKTKDVVSRIEYELDIIKTKGYSPYFIVVADIIYYARRSGILTNIRGSVAGSIVTYLLGITNIDPLEYKIPFERFLNPERPSAPDIDMDFADNRRDEVIEYVKQKYGEENVAQIGTFGTMLAKGAVRDVTRALGHPYIKGDKIANLIPLGSQGFPMTIDKALEIEPELAELYKKDDTTKEIINLAKLLEGCVRHVSVHAAGVVIAPTPLTDFVPTQLDPRGGKIITQYDMHAVEDAGLLKFDFLGIRNLATLAGAIILVKQLRNIEIDIENIPLDDKKTFTMLAKGDTMSVFQLSGGGMTRYLKELKPTTIHDINAMVALYRPGPMENIPHYIARKQKKEAITFLDPRMEEILDQSFGVVTYQDDVLMIAIKLAGYSWLEADMLRKAMGKKIPSVMAKEKKKFIDGCVNGKMAKQKAIAIWNLIEPFAAYGFNKAHAASYGRLAYQTAYMKANFPGEYMTAVLTAESGDTEKIAKIINECKQMNIPVLPPNINESFGGFTLIDSQKDNSAAKTTQKNKVQIRFGLYTIKHLGGDISDAIISERQNKGKFISLVDFLDRIKHKNLNKKSLDALVKSGAMDHLGERGVILANMEEILAYHREQLSGPSNQGSLFDGLKNSSSAPSLSLKESPPASAIEKLSWEHELLGLYVTGHPLDEHRDKLKSSNIAIASSKKLREGMLTIVAGIVSEMKVVNTKRGDHMAFLKISDYNDDIEAVAFPDVFNKHKDLLETKNRCIKIKGRISERNNEKSLVIEALKFL